ncbi:MAG: response regulator [Bdellovibrionales bacterium]|nr:response regulator [Bdellovibrionales bacterium]
MHDTGETMASENVLDQPRHLLPVLIVAKSATSSQLRQVFMAIGFNQISTSSGYRAALADAKENRPKIVFFDDDLGEDGADALTKYKFVSAIQALVRDVVIVALSQNATGEEMFNLMKVGCKAFLVPPCNAGAVEGVFLQIRDGGEISKELLHAEDRTGAFLEYIIRRLDWLASDLKSKPNGAGVDERIKGFRNLVQMATFFCESQEPPFAERAVEVLIQHAEDLDKMAAQTRLRKTREMLRAQRGKS